MLVEIKDVQSIVCRTRHKDCKLQKMRMQPSVHFDSNNKYYLRSIKGTVFDRMYYSTVHSVAVFKSLIVSQKY
jgi:hypothetical protein